MAAKYKEENSQSGAQLSPIYIGDKIGALTFNEVSCNAVKWDWTLRLQ